MMDVLWWWPLLFWQGLLMAWGTRARTSGSVLYATGVAAVTHGTWLICHAFVIRSVFDLMKGGSQQRMALVAAVYVTALTAGNACAMWASRRWLETGSRRIGA